MTDHRLVIQSSMTEGRRFDPPSVFVETWLSRLPAAAGARALDLAAGRGRHTALAAQAGYRTFMVDRAYDVVRAATRALTSAGLSVLPWCADLEHSPLPASRFDLVIVTRYLQRDLCDAIAASLRPGGVLLYETFTERQRTHGRGPTSPAHLLAPGELPVRFAALETLFYEEVEAPDALARLAARAPTSRS
jgi:SAM-dependent methyltransferase